MGRSRAESSIEPRGIMSLIDGRIYPASGSGSVYTPGVGSLAFAYRILTVNGLYSPPRKEARDKSAHDRGHESRVYVPNIYGYYGAC